MFSLFKRKKKYGGEIAYYGLTEWWDTCFSEDERKYVEGKYSPLGGSSLSLTNGEIQHSSASQVHFLSNLASWFNTPKDRELGYKIIKKAEESISNETETIDLHFLYQTKTEIYYKDRDKGPDFLDAAINSCLKQIALSPNSLAALREGWDGELAPSHHGFYQLAIIYEKQKDYEAVIELCQKAKLHGWAGDWDKRIQRCLKKQAKA